MAGGFVVIPIMPELLESIEEDPELNYDEEELNQNVSGMFIAAQGIGETVGPILGSVLESEYGFSNSQDIIAVSTTIFLLAYILICGRYLFKDTKLDIDDSFKTLHNKRDEIKKPLRGSFNTN